MEALIVFAVIAIFIETLIIIGFIRNANENEKKIVELREKLHEERMKNNILYNIVHS